MKLERSDVNYPLWRKKVDSSLFRQNGTTIPNWACKMWDIEKAFSSCISRNAPQSEVEVEFKGKQFKGWVTIDKEGRKIQSISKLKLKGNRHPLYLLLPNS